MLPDHVLRLLLGTLGVDESKEKPPAKTPWWYPHELSDLDVDAPSLVLISIGSTSARGHRGADLIRA